MESLFRPERLSQLLQRPIGRRVARDIEVQQSSGAVVHHHKDVDLAESLLRIFADHRSARRHQGGRRRHLDRQFHELRSRLHRPGAEDFATPGQPVRPEVVTYVLGTDRHLCLRSAHLI